MLVAYCCTPQTPTAHGLRMATLFAVIPPLTMHCLPHKKQAAFAAIYLLL
jgi:hypothetical protein